MKRSLTLLAAALLLAAPASVAQTRTAPAAGERAGETQTDAPGLLTYSGMLTDAAGAPLPDGTHRLTFRAYASESTSAPVWEESHDAVVTGGQFWVVLGARTPLADGAEWYTVSVDGAPESGAVRLGAGARMEGDGFAAGNTLDQAYDEGQVVNVDQGRPIVFRGPPGAFYTGLQIQNLTATFSNDELVRFRLRSVNGGASWEYRVYGSAGANLGAVPPGSFAISNASSPGAKDAFIVFPNAAEDLLRLDASTVRVGSAAAPSELAVYTTSNPSDPDAGFESVRVENWLGQGGSIRLAEDNGATYATIQPLVTGQGGYFRLTGPNGAKAIEILGSGAAGSLFQIGASGTSQTYFDTGSTGTDAVRLPADAIHSAEVGDEAGAVNATNPNSLGLSPGNQVTLTRSITAPADGYVLAYGTSELRTSHTTGSTSNIQFAVSQDCDGTPTAPVTQQANTQTPSALPTGSYSDIVTVHGLFSVTAGVHTFCNFVQLINSTTGSIDDQNLTLIFVPTAYGITQPNLGEGGAEREDQASPALTVADVQAERAEAVQANEARIQAELRTIQQRIAELEAQMGNERR